MKSKFRIGMLGLKASLIILILHILSLGVLAQGTDTGNASIPISPENPHASSLMKMHKEGIDLYRGVIDINLSLFNLTEGVISVPINLTYKTGGIKVAEFPTWVGLGWNLECGGTIVRKVNGYQDEKGYGGYMYSKQSQASLYWLDDDVWNSVGTTPLPNNQARQYYDKTRFQYYTGVDLAPDEFIYNVLGRKGKIVFDGFGIPHSDENVKVEIQKTSTKILSWTLTFDDGLKCIFDEVEQVLSLDEGITVNGSSTGGEGGYSDVMWHITHIYSPMDLDHIQFVYELDNSQTFMTSKFEKYWLQNVTDAPYNSNNPYKNYAFSAARNSERPKRLTQIISANYEIRFIRTQLDYARFKTALSSIEINVRGTRLKRFDLSYKQYGIKFFLESVQEYGADSSLLPPYKFTYHELSLPEYNDDASQSPSYAGVDCWGYYNGPQTYRTQIPYHDVSNNALGHLSSLDRAPNFYYMKAGILEKIEFPTGGTVEYTYGQNDYSYLRDGQRKEPKILAGGLRIERIVRKESNATIFGIETTYKYVDSQNKSSGIITSDPYYSFSLNLPGNEYFIGTWGQIWLDEPIEHENITYSRVVEESVGGYTVFDFYNKVDTPYPFLNEDEAYLFIYVIKDDRMLFQKFNHPFRKAIPDEYPKWGKLKSKNTYSGGDKFLEGESYDYEIKPVKSFVGRSLFGIDSWGMNVTVNFPSTLWFFHRYNVHLEKALLSSKTIMEADPNDFTRMIQKVENYDYTNVNSLLSEKREITSHGDLLVTKYFYPEDYSLTNPYVVSLRNNRILNKPVEKQTIINGQLIFHEISEYTAFGKLKSRYNKEFSIPFIPSPFNVDGPVLSSEFNKSVEHNYGSDGRVISSIFKSGASRSYLWDNLKQNIWGYGNTHPIAEIKNATNVSSTAQFPFTNFGSVEITEYVGNTTFLPAFEINSSQQLSVTVGLLGNGTNLPPSPLVNLVLKRADESIVSGINGVWGQNTYSISVGPGVYQWYYSTGDISFSHPDFTSVYLSVSNSYSTGKTGSRIFYTSFEDEGNHTAVSYTGKKSWYGQYTVYLPAQNGNYKLTYMMWSGSDWEYIIQDISVTSGVIQSHVIGNAGSIIDEVRLYPADAQMTTYSYKPEIGVTSSADPNCIVTYYDYDSFGRLQTIKDHQGNILKEFVYHYKNQN